MMPSEGSQPVKGLPVGFRFSQSSLQDFVDCRRRFQLRYLWNLSWPALESEPAHEHEDYMRQGAAFHHMVHQHIQGVSAERIGSQIQDPALLEWWQNYLGHARFAYEGDYRERYPEISLSTSMGATRLIAKYDLVLFDRDGRVTILDWKTSRRHPKRIQMADRLQTRVYPYLMVRAGAVLNGGQPFAPKQVEMLYWFTNFPTDPVRFEYGQDQYQQDDHDLRGLVKTIGELETGSFFLTQDEKRCRFCVYRSLCDRGVQAGPSDHADDEWLDDELSAASFDMEQVAEIEF
jgi:hypothetical protein